MSQQINDWYNTEDSQYFIKKQYNISGKIFIEGSELGDLMVNSGVEFIQGIESPYETSVDSVDQCGQSITFTFFMKIFNESHNANNIPNGNDEGYPYSFDGFNASEIWTYRRAFTNNMDNSYSQMYVGDITQQNWGNGNDFDNGYLFLSIHDTKSQQNSGWKGGINLTVLSMAEQRAFGFYHYYINNTNHNISMDTNETDTFYGLSQFPYLRDTRRPLYGLNNFRLNHTTMLDLYNNTNKYNNYSVGYKFNDTIAIGNYPFDSHFINTTYCNNNYPNYTYNISTQSSVPFYIPFRSIAHNNITNILFTGKNIAQTFWSNTCTRLHPSEWNIGVACGAAAQYMMSHNTSNTIYIYNNINQFQTYLVNNIKSVIDWS